MAVKPTVLEGSQLISFYSYRKEKKLLTGIGLLMEGPYHVVCRGESGLASLRKTAMLLLDVSKLDLAYTKTRPQEPMSK